MDDVRRGAARWRFRGTGDGAPNQRRGARMQHRVPSPWDGHRSGVARVGGEVPPASGGGAPQMPQQLPQQ